MVKNKLEQRLAENVLFSITEKVNKDFVRQHYNKYLNYINRDGIHCYKELFEKVDKMYVNYIKR